MSQILSDQDCIDLLCAQLNTAAQLSQGLIDRLRVAERERDEAREEVVRMIEVRMAIRD